MATGCGGLLRHRLNSNSGLGPVLDASSVCASLPSCTVQPQHQSCLWRFFRLLDELRASAVFSSLAGILRVETISKTASLATVFNFKSLIIIAPEKNLQGIQDHNYEGQALRGLSDAKYEAEREPFLDAPTV